MRIRQIFLFSVALGSTMGAMAAMLFAAQQWSAFEAAQTVQRDTRFLERMLRVPEMMNMERAFINIRMIDADAASPTQLATILRQTALVDAAISDARSLTPTPEDATALLKVKDSLLDVRQAALAAIALPRNDRPKTEVATYLTRMFAVQEVTYNQVTDLQERINVNDPYVGQSTRLARLAWDVRDLTGRQTTTLINDLGRRLPLSGVQAEVLAEFKGRIEQEWAAVRYTAGQLARPEITAVLATADHRYWAGGGEAYTTYVVSDRDPLSGVDLDRFALAIRPILDSVLEVRDSAMREALRQSSVDVTFRRVCLLAALGLVILTACTIAAATWWFDRRVVRPIGLITSTILRLAEGFRDVLVPLQDRDDELGQMATAIETLRGNALEAQTVGLEMLAMQQLRAEEQHSRAEEKSRLLDELTKSHDELSALNSELESLATTDALTKVPNRRSFDLALAREWRRARREEMPLGLLMLDIDYFKTFNDRYGHPAGDNCLARVAAAVEGAIRRPGDTAARYGGEEFAVILPHTDLAGAAEVAERIRRAVTELNVRHAGSPEGIVTASIGVASINVLHEVVTTEELVSCADAALYAAKRAGRNQTSMADQRRLRLQEHNVRDHAVLENS